MADEFDEIVNAQPVAESRQDEATRREQVAARLRTYDRTEIRQLEQRMQAAQGTLSPVEQLIADRHDLWDILREKYPLPEGARVYTSTNMDTDPVIAFVKYAELAVNAYGFDPMANPSYTPDLDPLPKQRQHVAQQLGQGVNTFSKKLEKL